jgi:hypothetical protein
MISVVSFTKQLEFLKKDQFMSSPVRDFWLDYYKNPSKESFLPFELNISVINSLKNFKEIDIIDLNSLSHTKNQYYFSFNNFNEIIETDVTKMNLRLEIILYMLQINSIYYHLNFIDKTEEEGDELSLRSRLDLIAKMMHYFSLIEDRLRISSLMHSYRRVFFSMLLNMHIIKMKNQTVFITPSRLLLLFSKAEIKKILDNTPFPQQHQISLILGPKKNRFFTELQLYAISKLKYQYFHRQHELTWEIIEKFWHENLTNDFIKEQSGTYKNVKEYIVTTFSYNAKK